MESKVLTRLRTSSRLVDAKGDKIAYFPVGSLPRRPGRSLHPGLLGVCANMLAAIGNGPRKCITIGRRVHSLMCRCDPLLMSLQMVRLAVAR